MRRSGSEYFGRQLAISHPGHFADSAKPTLEELRSLPPLTGLKRLPPDVIPPCESLGGDDLKPAAIGEEAAL